MNSKLLSVGLRAVLAGIWTSERLALAKPRLDLIAGASRRYRYDVPKGWDRVEGGGWVPPELRSHLAPKSAVVREHAERLGIEVIDFRISGPAYHGEADVCEAST